jgi:hypothetical protein
MATKPGPIVALAALGALFFMGRKKGPTKDTLDLDDLANSDATDDLKEGGTVADSSPGGGISKSGGTKRPKGKGVGGGDFDPPAGLLDSGQLWFSPDCQTIVIPRAEQWAVSVFIPRVKEVDDQLRARKSAYKADVYTLVGLALDILDMDASGNVFASKRPHIELIPYSCLAKCPLFSIGNYPTREVLDSPDRKRLDEDLRSWANEFPAMYAFVISMSHEVLARDNQFADRPSLSLPTPAAASMMTDTGTLILTDSVVVEEGKPPELPSPPPSEVIELLDTPASSNIEGFVLDHNSLPIPAVKITLTSANGDSAVAATNPSGAFAFNVEPGTYLVEGESDRWAWTEYVEVEGGTEEVTFILPAFVAPNL